MRIQPLDKINLFYCYTREDNDLKKKLEQALVGLKREDLLEDWSEAKIKAGETLTQKMEQYLEAADILLLLISPSFLASDYCYQVLLPRALQRHRAGNAVTILVLLRPVDWHDSSFSSLPKLPSTGKPVSVWSQRDEAFNNVAQGIRSQFKDIWLRKGDTHYQAGHYEEALLSFEQAIRQDETFVPAYIRQGSVLRNMMRYKEAEVSFDAALEHNPTDANAYFELGILLYDTKAYSHAVSAFDQAIRLNHLSVAAHIYKGLALENFGKVPMAQATYEDYLRIHPSDPVASLFLRDLNIRIQMRPILEAFSSSMREIVQSLRELSYYDFPLEFRDFEHATKVLTHSTEVLMYTMTKSAFGITKAIKFLENFLREWQSMLKPWSEGLQLSKSEDKLIGDLLNNMLRLESNTLKIQLDHIPEVLKLVDRLAHPQISYIGDTLNQITNEWGKLTNAIAQEQAEHQNLSERLLHVLRQSKPTVQYPE